MAKGRSKPANRIRSIARSSGFKRPMLIFFPTGRSIQAHGVEPDFIVTAAPGLSATQHFERE